MNTFSKAPANKVKCSIDLNYQSIANDELVVLQDKFLHPLTRTVLHSMTSEDGTLPLLVL